MSDAVHTGSGSPRWAAGVVLAVLVFLAYASALGGGFVWDDDDYVTENVHLRSAEGLRTIWLDPQATPQYYPLVHTSFWLEYRMWRLDPFGYHLVNVLLHLLVSLLLWRLSARLGVPAAWWVAAVFALHPVHVESVAWITERKNVMSAVFYLAAFVTLVPVFRLGRGGDADGRASSPRVGLRYALGVVLFGCALLSKSVTASLPAALLLVAWWKRRLDRRAWALAVPLLLLGVVAGLFTAYLERVHVGAFGPEWDLGAVTRLLIAGRAVCFYAGKLWWPADLTFIYPRWAIDPSSALAWSGVIASLGAVLVAFLGRARWGRGPLTAVLFFGGTLLPALGFLNTYPMRYSFVADHFQYLASIGLLMLTIAVVANGWRRLQERGVLGSAGPRVGVAAASTVLLALALTTFRQGLDYRDVETLWRATLERNPDAWMARDNLAIELQRQADRVRASSDPEARLRARQLDAEATALLTSSLRLHTDADAYYNLAEAHLRASRFADAVPLLEASLALDDRAVGRRLNLAVALGEVGREADAIATLQAVLDVQPDHPAALYNLGSRLLGAHDPALRDLEAARDAAGRAVAVASAEDPRPLALLAMVEQAREDGVAAGEAAREALVRARRSPHYAAYVAPLERLLAEVAPR